jgi:hypothetical protein
VPDAVERRRQADESLARHLSRLMKASTSALGVWSDPPLIGLAGAVTVSSALLVARFVATPVPSWALWGFALLPFAVGICATLALSGARRKVVDWLGSLPFPLENANGLLNGVGQNLRIRFRASRPSREELDEALRQIHEECFALEFYDQEPEVDVRIGVLDSKLNPARANHRRYLRVQAILGRALVPLSERYPIEHVWVC